MLDGQSRKVNTRTIERKNLTIFKMKFSKSKWLAHTLLVGLIPILIRLLAWFTTTNGSIRALAEPDLITLGLIIHISVINELEHLTTRRQEWKTIQNGLSIVFIVLYSVLYTVTIIGERSSYLIDENALLFVSTFLVLTSAGIGLTVFHRLARGK